MSKQQDANNIIKQMSLSIANFLANDVRVQIDKEELRTMVYDRLTYEAMWWASLEKLESMGIELTEAGDE